MSSPNWSKKPCWQEFDRIAERGGVLGPWKPATNAARFKTNPCTYEMLKHTGELPIIGVNTFRNPNGEGPRKRLNWRAPPRKKNKASCNVCKPFTRASRGHSTGHAATPTTSCAAARQRV
jgi:methylmalonyl-CoA mutase N-terminal domain/subunit